MIEKLLQRIKWRLENGTFTPNENDATNLKEIYKWVNDQKNITLNDNHLFAKLYIYFLNQHLDKFESTVFDHIGEIELHKLLSKDLDTFYVAFANSLNTNNRYEVLRSHGITVEHPALKSDEQLKDEKVKLKNLNPKNLQNIFDVEEVRTNLNKLITDTLNKYQ